MDAAQALAELTQVSSQIERAAIFGADGGVVGATGSDGAELAAAGQRLLEQAALARDGALPAQVDVSTAAGNVFVLRDHELTIVATTKPQPTTGLVFYDLKSCLRALESEKPKPKRRAPRKKKEEQTDET